jgi:hypothetical protein
MGSDKAWRAGLVLILLSTAGLSQEPRHSKVIIVIYDSAQIGVKTLDRTEAIARTILQTAGVQPDWNAGSVEELRNMSLDFTAYSRANCEERPSSAVLRVWILSRAPSGVAPHALGFSLPCARVGVQVTIYADRVADVSQSGGPTFGRVLGYAIAHELGHMLLRSDVHEAGGLMKAIWSQHDWQRAAVSIVPFSATDVQRIRAFPPTTRDPRNPSIGFAHAR